MDFQTIKPKLSNFWYYHKWTVAVIAVIVITFTFFTVQCATRTHADYAVVLYLDQTVSFDQRVGLQKILERSGEDINGDGQVVVEIFDVSYSNQETNPNVIRANQVKSIGQMSLSDSMIYITDQSRFPEYAQHNLFQTLDWLPDQEGRAWNWQGSEIQALMSELGMPENLYFSLRRIEGTKVENQAGANERLAQSETLLRRVIQSPTWEQTE